MAIDVHEPSSRDYLTKPTSLASTPPCRDHQHNNNQIISTITTKDTYFDFERLELKYAEERAHEARRWEEYAEERAHEARRWEEEKARRLEEAVAREAEYVTKRAQEREEEKQRDARWEAQYAEIKAGLNLLNTTTTTIIESPKTTTDTNDTHSITDTPTDIPTATISPIASSTTETKIRPEVNTDAESTATAITTTTTEEEEEEEEEVRTINDHDFYTTHDRTDEASDTTITATTTSTPAKTRKLPKTLAEMMIPPELREALAQACAPLAKIFDANTAEYVFEMYIKDPFFDDEVARELVSEILFDRAVACEVRDRICACNADIAYNAEMNRPPPTNTKIQPTMTTNKTVTPPKDRPVPVISNKKTKKTKKKHKQVTPPKTKTIHEIKRPIVTVEEVNRYLQHVQNNPDRDEFPMNNLPIRTQIAQCEVEYYKMRNTNPALAEVDMDFYHSLPPVQVLLGEMTRLEGLAMKLAANDNDTTNNTNTTTTTTHTADRLQPNRHTNKDTISKTEPNNNNNNNIKTSDNPAKADDDKCIAEQARDTKRKHKEAMEREQAWHRNNNQRMSFEANKRETEKEKEREKARHRCETARVDLARKLPKKQQQAAMKEKHHQLQVLKLRETQRQQAQQLNEQKEQDHEQMKQQQECLQLQQQEQEKQRVIEQQRISDNRKKVSAAQRDRGKQKKKVRYVSIGTSDVQRHRSKDPGKYGLEFGMQMIADRFGDGWHKSVGKSFGVQRIAALFGDGVT